MRQARSSVAALLILLTPVAASAELVMQGSSGSGFRRVKVGDSLTGKRITVQIDPAEQAVALSTFHKLNPT